MSGGMRVLQKPCHARGRHAQPARRRGREDGVCVARHRRTRGAGKGGGAFARGVCAHRHALEATVSVERHDAGQDGDGDALGAALLLEGGEDLVVVEELSDDRVAARVLLLLQVDELDLEVVVTANVLDPVHDHKALLLRGGELAAQVLDRLDPVGVALRVAGHLLELQLLLRLQLLARVEAWAPRPPAPHAKGGGNGGVCVPGWRSSCRGSGACT